MENLPTNLVMSSKPLQQAPIINSSIRPGWGQRRNAKQAKENQQEHHGQEGPSQTGDPRSTNLRVSNHPQTPGNNFHTCEHQHVRRLQHP